MPVVAIGEGDALVRRIDGDNTAVTQRDAMGVVSQVTTLSSYQRDVWRKGPSVLRKAATTQRARLAGLWSSNRASPIVARLQHLA